MVTQTEIRMKAAEISAHVCAILSAAIPQKPLYIDHYERNDICTFANCGYRDEEILDNYAYDRAGIIGFVTDPGLLDWSACNFPGREGCCESKRSENGCPLGFRS